MQIKDYYGNEECPECHRPIPDDAKAGDLCECETHRFTNTFNKITNGFVIQNYKTLSNGTHVCTGQEFIAGDVSYRSTEYGDGIDVDPQKEVYCPLEMMQSKEVPEVQREKLIGRNYEEVEKEMDFRGDDEADAPEKFLTYIDSLACSVCTRCKRIVDMRDITATDFFGCKNCDGDVGENR